MTTASLCLPPAPCSGIFELAMGFAVPESASWENRLSNLSANDACRPQCGEVGFMMNALWIFIGGGLGSLARWGASDFVAHKIGETFPWGTLLVNISGSFVIGLFATVTGPEGRWFLSATFRQFFMLGVCGG